MDLKRISIVVSDTSDLSEILPLALLLLLPHPKVATYKVLQIYFGCSAVLKLYALVTSKFGMNNMHAYHLLACVELVLVYLFYLELFQKKSAGFSLGLFLLLGFNVTHTILYGKYNEFNNVAWGLNASIIIVFGFVYYYQLYQQAEKIQIEKYPLFFINAGFLIYAAGSFFTYLFGWKILSGEAIGLFHNAWLIQSISNLVKNIVIAYGLWILKET